MLVLLIYGVAGLVLTLAVVVGVLWILGTKIPVEHTATGVIDLPITAAEAFGIVNDIRSHPTWAKGVTRVEMLPEKNGLEVCRMSAGRNSFVLTRTRMEVPRVIERTIADDHGPFSGVWRHEFKEGASGGCTVRLTEIGRVKSPIPRAMMKYVFGYHLYLNMHLKSLGEKCGARDGPRRG